MEWKEKAALGWEEREGPGNEAPELLELWSGSGGTLAETQLCGGFLSDLSMRVLKISGGQIITGLPGSVTHSLYR